MSRLLEELDAALIDPSEWEIRDVPAPILDAAYAATQIDNLAAIGKTDELGWFVLIRLAEKQD